MAQVFRATLEGPMGYAKEVAIKLVAPRLVNDDNNIRALVNEARIGGLLRHPNIVEVYDLDQVDGHWFVAMELIRGKTLSDVLKRCRQTDVPLPRSVILEIGIEIAAGLHYAHTFRTADGKKAGLIHRDLKPPNVMLSDRGEVKIMDFGIARSSMNFYLTTTDTPLRGTPMYMAPEQMEQGTLTPAADLFAFGAMLFELVTNRRLFLARDVRQIIVAVMGADLGQRLAPMRERDAQLGEVAARCLERNLDERLGSSRQLHDELVALREAEPDPLSLAEFVAYLQQAVDLGAVAPPEPAAWSWTLNSAPRSASFDPEEEESVSIRRSIEHIAHDLEPFGQSFFGPVQQQDPDFAQIQRMEQQPGFCDTQTGEGQAPGLEGAARPADPIESAPLSQTREREPARTQRMSAEDVVAPRPPPPPRHTSAPNPRRSGAPPRAAWLLAGLLALTTGALIIALVLSIRPDILTAPRGDSASDDPSPAGSGSPQRSEPTDSQAEVIPAPETEAEVTEPPGTGNADEPARPDPREEIAEVLPVVALDPDPPTEAPCEGLDEVDSFVRRGQPFSQAETACLRFTALTQDPLAVSDFTAMQIAAVGLYNARDGEWSKAVERALSFSELSNAPNLNFAGIKPAYDGSRYGVVLTRADVVWRNLDKGYQLSDDDCTFVSEFACRAGVQRHLQGTQSTDHDRWCRIWGDRLQREGKDATEAHDLLAQVE
jgi:eukaryotic-like serine/threonine-protein kinase